jgi:NAD(P)-dependent dehydrogenase (short-subunit alcohol dehydrogenase family)
MAPGTLSDGERGLRGRNVIVTGASRGLGADLAGAMWRAGANLLLVGRSESSLRRVRDQLIPSGAEGQEARVVEADLASSRAVPGIVGEARKTWARLDVLVNNAAIVGPIGKAWESAWNEWEATIRIDLLAPIELCLACVAWMAEAGGGKIINVSGGGASSPRPNFSAYATAKTGLVRFSEILAGELYNANIQVNCVAPGRMNTDMLGAIRNAGPGRAGAREYAEAVKVDGADNEARCRAVDLCMFLASPASDGITGKLLSAIWDPWETLPAHLDDLRETDIYTLRRIIPRDRGRDWA